MWVKGEEGEERGLAAFNDSDRWVDLSAMLV